MSAAGGGRPPARASLAPALILLLFVAGRCLVPMDETDLFYNLRLGEIVLATRSVPRTNLLSFTYPGFPDPNLAWIFQMLLALAHRAGGIAGTVVLKTAFVVATFALLHRTAIRRGAHPVAAAVALALAAWAAEPRFVERPHLVTFLGLGYLLLALERAERGAPRCLLALVPLGLLWANGNSCFFLAPVVLGLHAAGAWLDGRPKDGRRAGLIAACLVPLAFATPSGTGVVAYVANHFRMPTLRPLQEYRIAEWPLDGPFFLLAGGVVLTTVLLAVDRARVRGARQGRPWPRDLGARHLLPVAALAVLGARRIRFVAEFALLAGPVLAVHVTRLAARLSIGRSAGRAAVGLGLVALLLATAHPRLAALRAGEAWFDLGIEPDLVPTGAIDWIEAHGLRDHLYNDLEVGSFLTWRGWPEHRVFQDPRINAYPADWHAFLRRTDQTPREWDAFLRPFGVRAALLSFPDVNPRAALFHPHGWALVHRAADALVFARREPANAALIAAEEIPLTFRLVPGAGGLQIRTLPLDEQPRESTLAPCEWQRRLGDLLVERNDAIGAARAYAVALAAPADCLTPPGIPTAISRDELRVRAAAVALQLDQWARAAALLEGLSRPDARLNRGFALLALGRPAEALVELEAARAALPDEPQAAFGVGLALVRLGRTDEAAGPLRALLARWPGHFAAPEARRLLARLRR